MDRVESLGEMQYVLWHGSKEKETRVYQSVSVLWWSELHWCPH